MYLYFKRSEFAQPAGYGFPRTEYPEEWWTDPTRGGALIPVLDMIREAIGEPLLIQPGGGLRTEAYNDAMYRSIRQKPTKSQHIPGRAADIRAKTLPVATLYRTVNKLISIGTIKVGGVGYYPSKGFVHIDVRSRPKGTGTARWTSTSKHKSNT